MSRGETEMSAIKPAFQVLGGFGIFVGLLLVSFLVMFLFIQGGLWLSSVLYPILATISGLTLLFVIGVLLPNAFFSAVPKFAGSGMFMASLIFGACAWTWSFLLTYMLWGWSGLLLGLFLAGIGVVPLAMLATLYNAEWSIFGQL